jgi:hypothetical protein
MTRTLAIAAATVAVLVVRRATAQQAEPMDRGPLIAAPVAVLIGPDSGCTGNPLDTRQLYSKPPGFQPVRPRPPGSGSPDFSWAALFHDRTNPAQVPAIDVDAFSIGQDVLFADPATGRVVIPPNGWLALLVSVERRTAPTATAPAIREEEARPDGAGADVFSYVVRHSALPPELVGVTRRALDGEELCLSRPSRRGEIRALDAHLTRYDLDPEATRWLPREVTVYFSVSAGTIAAVPAAWWGGTMASGATILRTRWVASTARWDEPRPFRAAAELMLQPDDDIDALAVEEGPDDVDVVFSTVVVPRGAVTSQLMFAACGGVGAGAVVPVVYSDPDGAPIAEETGVGEEGNIDAVCVIDPGPATGVPPPPEGGGSLAPFTWGSPQASVAPALTRLSAATYRSGDGAGGLAYQSFMTGWTAAGRRTGWAFLALSVDGRPWQSPVFARPASGWGGDPQTVTIRLPPIPLLGIAVTGIWVATDDLGGIAVSHPVRLMF